MKIVNLTPHSLRVRGVSPISGKEVWFEIPPSGEVARVRVEYRPARELPTCEPEVEGAPTVVLHQATYGDVEGVPDPKPGTLYVVSGMVEARLSHREDVVAPGNLIRDEEGRVVGCDGFKKS